MKITDYTVRAPLSRSFTIALLSDLHTDVPEGLLQTIKERSPDFIAIAGDLVDYTTRDLEHKLISPTGFEEIRIFLEALVRIAPVFYASGNHDILRPREIGKILETGTVFLDNKAITHGEFVIGGLSSGYGKSVQSRWKKTPAPDVGFAERFSQLKGYKILLSHHPEYYPRYLKPLSIDLILSGHAHGGQWRFFGRGVFAPGQGLFPKYTAGVHDNRLIISRGLGNHTFIPRLFNPCEIVFVTLKP